jgi:glutamyl-tRNA reductase
MGILALGINHNTASVEIREKVAFGPDALDQAITSLNQVCQEAVIISTCNRVEIYCHDDAIQSTQIAQWLAEFHQVPLDELDASLYLHSGEDAVQHLMRVACGLDSLVLGEPQILGQLKQAFSSCQDLNSTGTCLDRLFQQAFSVAKQVRTDTSIGSSAVSVAYAAVTLAKRIYNDMQSVSALFIGAGETIELAARHLYNQGTTDIIVANRTVERAENLAELFKGVAIKLSDIPNYLENVDIVIASTASPLPILGKGMVETALKKRKHKPMFMVDLAVPRDIESQVSELDDVYLYTVDDLQGVIQENLKARQQAAEEAEDIIDFQANRFMHWLRSLESVSTIRAFRKKHESLGKKELKRSLESIDRGEDPELVMRELLHRLNNKFMHDISTNLRQIGGEGARDKLAIAREILGIEK